MKPFNYKECMEKHGGYAVTRDGRKVRLLCDDATYEDQPIIGLVYGTDGVRTIGEFCADGTYYAFTANSALDLFTPIKTTTYWVNIYKGPDLPYTGDAYTSERMAKKNKEIGYIKTISFEIEE